MKCRFEFAASAKRLAILSGFPAMALMVVGCQVHTPDVAGDVEKATGISGAIEFRTSPSPIDGREFAGSLSLEQAIRMAVFNDPRIQSALAGVRAAEADAKQVSLLPNPIISLDIRFPTVSGSNRATEASLAEDLIALLQKPTQMAAANKRLRASAGNALTAVLDVISEVQVAYATARSVDATIANSQQRLEILQHLREIAQNRLTVGEGVQLDVITLDAQILQTQLALSDLQVQRDEQRFLLAKLIGQPRSKADWQLSPWDGSPVEGAPESVWIDTALKNRPEVASRIWELRALGDDSQVAGFLPFTGTQLGVHAEHDPQWRVGPTLSIPVPIFDFGQATRAKLQAQVIAARADLSEQQLNVIQEVRVAYMTYERSRETLEIATDKLVPLQRKEVEQTRRAYQEGDVDLATLQLAETDMQSALATVVDLQQKVTIARVKLERAAGGTAVAARLRKDAHVNTTMPASSHPATSRISSGAFSPTTSGNLP